MPPGIELTDFVTIGLLVLLEAALSADNALVLAVLVLPLPVHQQKQALRYGILGAVLFRVLSTTFAAAMIHMEWVKLVGAIYLLYLPLRHFRERPDQPGPKQRPVSTFLGLSAFWSTVVRVELTDIVFAIDSILVAVAVSRKVWVVVMGGVLGILAIRALIGQLLGFVRRYPAIVEGAYVIVAWVGIKLMIEYLHGIGVLGWEIPRWLSITVILILFGLSAIYAKRQERRGASSMKSTRDLAEP
jgi:YkoY family integral membrane protein